MTCPLPTSIAARVRAAIVDGFTGTDKDLARMLDVDVRRIYSARHYLGKHPKAGTRWAQPAKRTKVFAGEMPPELRAMREQARSVVCPTCRRSSWCVTLGQDGETFEWGVHVERARLAGCPPIPSVAELNQKGRAEALFR